MMAGRQVPPSPRMRTAPHSTRWRIPALAATLVVGLWPMTGALAGYADIVIDAESGRVYHATAADAQNYPASLTKMMTLYLLFDALDAGKVSLDQEFTVSAHAAAQAPSKLGLNPGDTIKVRDIIPIIVTKSANDMAVTVAENLAGDEARFAQLMTQKAHKLGMSQTTFRNASGLPNPKQKTTARDMARLGQAMIQDHARYYPYFKTESYTYNGVTMANHNHLMSRYEGMDGLKTGFTDASGFNLVASAVHDGRRLIAVVMGGPSAVGRDNRMAELLDMVFDGAPVMVAQAPVHAPGQNTATTRLASAENRAASAVAHAAGQVARSTLLPQKAEAEPAVPQAQAYAVPQTSQHTASAARPAGGWSIQIGAYAARAAGQRAVAATTQSLGGILDNAVPSIQPVTGAHGMLYRARLTGLDEATAQTACARLSQQGRQCLAIAPVD